MPTPTSQPDSPAPPPTAIASGGTPWANLESDIHALKLQALATQKSIQQLQTHEPANPLQSMQSGLDGTAVGVTAALGLTLALAWWFLWYRPQTRPNDSLSAPKEVPQPPPETAPLSTQKTANAPPSPASTLGGDVQDGYFARNDPSMGFDSEAAAGEVVRVRKSLADKREARMLQQDYEREETNHPTPPPFPVADVTQSEPEMVLDLDLDLEPESVSLPVPESVLAPEPAVAAEPESEPINLLEPMPMPQPDLDPQPEQPFSPQPDFAITLALAEESEALDLWPEARELATEVLDSSDAELRAQAQALLARLDTLEDAMAQESLPPPSLALKDPTA